MASRESKVGKEDRAKKAAKVFRLSLSYLYFWRSDISAIRAARFQELLSICMDGAIFVKLSSSAPFVTPGRTAPIKRIA